MKITKMEEQGILLAMCIAKRGSQMTLPELAEEECLSEALIAKVMGKLRRGGIVNAARGRTGGYELTAAPEAITVIGILRSLERPLLDGCVGSGGQSDNSICPHISDCGLRPVWQLLENNIMQVLDKLTLADLIERERDVREKVTVFRQGYMRGGRA